MHQPRSPRLDQHACSGEPFNVQRQPIRLAGLGPDAAVDQDPDWIAHRTSIARRRTGVSPPSRVALPCGSNPEPRGPSCRNPFERSHAPLLPHGLVPGIS
jgi:hypothetical protein